MTRFDLVLARSVGLAAVLLAGSVALAAEPPRAVHGSSDAFAAPGIALAWGVLRGAGEASTAVVVRVVTDPGAYPQVAVVGIDPFTKGERSVRPAAASSGTADVRIPRSQFADFPHTELRLYASAEAAGRSEPALVVYYHGVPDTTPEFNDPARLDAHLAARIAAVQAPGGKPR